MQHQIPIEELGPQGPAMAHAVETCVHCGFCLAACPTYRILGEEMDSPRGRIVLMKDVLEGSLALKEALPYIDLCLGCLACVPACPSGVPYGELLTPFRARAEKQRRRSLSDRLVRFTVQSTLPHPGRFRLAATTGRLARPLLSLLPGDFRAMIDLVPGALPSGRALPDHYPAEGTRRARVVLLAGCVQQVLAPEINWATLRVLAANGVEVIIPKAQGCCGALALHAGDARRARGFARANLRAFPTDVDAVITNAAGCGSGMKEYPLLLKGTDQEEAATALAARTKDISAFLDEIGLVAPPPAVARAMTLAYHDACHLAHAQGVRDAPRRLLASIPGVTLVEIPDGDLCCGSAGTYNLEHPDLARQLGERKARNILGTGAEALATGNIGCLTQIQSQLAALGHSMPLLHTVQVLDRAYARTL
jgi:glycolate oxidase iron-sulfur subunit